MLNKEDVFIRMWTGEKYENVRFDKISDVNEKMKSDLAIAKEALEFYEKKKHYQTQNFIDEHGKCKSIPVCIDFGLTAQIARQKMEGK